MSYEPKETEIADKVDDLLFTKISQLDYFNQPLIAEAIGNDDGELIQVLLKFANATSIDKKLACHDDFIKALKKYFNLEDEARDFLIGQVGYYKKISEDDERFVANSQG